MRLLILIISFLTINLASFAKESVEASRKLQLTDLIIQKFYVDSIDANKIVEQGIIAMLKELDPHSTYTTAEETKALTEPLNGNFSGIGVQFQMVQDTVYVIQAVPSGPSEKVGIIPGDRIIAANDTIIAGLKLQNSQVMKQLRGPKGSIVNLKVVRRNEPDTLVFRVKRDDIPLYTIDANFMADQNTGYIRISSFGATTVKEFNEAIEKLQKQGMKDLIIDVQDNGGGYLASAVNLTEQFLPEGTLIVYTEGLKQAVQRFTANNKKANTNSNIIILVNEFSASASEILAGAMQDNDRAVIVGRRTFGKGLVQRPFSFEDGSMIRLTTAHYYTPSGRSIQKPYSKGNIDDYKNDIENRFKHGEFYSLDSIKLDEKLKYHTANGRVVYGGGGIMPDYFVPADTTGITKYFKELRAKNVINQYVVDFVESNRANLNKYKTEDAFVNNFEVSTDMINDFIALGEKLGVSHNPDEFALSKSYILGNIKGLIGRDLFTSSTYYRVMNPLNDTFTTALRIINNKEEYHQILNAE